ncbi:NAD(P)/FAD-dependent oxidoreductase [Microbacterium sp.]|uniref:NAD(P)/FAD-dependent oxidoreductase n=1 Tax=Microbacterium sp. TaxID=51671 RepID=UPI002624AB64|nr:NAD(P)/FAD-dependent oxidoreductase [Microbacterium sp.]
MTANDLYDSTIIGGGPAGLSAAMMLGRARRRILIVDDESPRNRFTQHMHAVVGFDGAAPDELRRRGRLELAQYDVTFVTSSTTRVDDDGDRLRVQTDAGSYATRTLINATGAVDELAPIDGLAQLWGSRILHCPYCHGWEVRDKRIAVIATALMGLFQAELLRQWTSTLTAFIADAGAVDETAIERMKARGTQVNAEPVERISRRADGALDIVTRDGVATTVDAVFTGSTLIPRDLGLPDALERTSTGFLVVDGNGRSNHPRIWSAGNAANPYANVPMSMGNGSAVGGAVNLALVEEDSALVLSAAAEELPAIACNYASA